MDPVWRRQWDRGPEPTLHCGSFLDLFVSWSPELVCVCVGLPVPSFHEVNFYFPTVKL